MCHIRQTYVQNIHLILDVKQQHYLYCSKARNKRKFCPPAGNTAQLRALYSEQEFLKSIGIMDWVEVNFVIHILPQFQLIYSFLCVRVMVLLQRYIHIYSFLGCRNQNTEDRCYIVVNGILENPVHIRLGLQVISDLATITANFLPCTQGHLQLFSPQGHIEAVA